MSKEKPAPTPEKIAVKYDGMKWKKTELPKDEKLRRGLPTRAPYSTGAAKPVYAPQVPKDFVHMDAYCVCGEKLVLELQPPDYKAISWHKFCLKCRHHIYFSVSQ